ncbi:unnamed protein product [Musa acuminata var. zebrina]
MEERARRRAVTRRGKQAAAERRMATKWRQSWKRGRAGGRPLATARRARRRETRAAVARGTRAPERRAAETGQMRASAVMKGDGSARRIRTVSRRISSALVGGAPPPTQPPMVSIWISSLLLPPP